MLAWKLTGGHGDSYISRIRSQDDPWLEAADGGSQLTLTPAGLLEGEKHEGKTTS